MVEWLKGLYHTAAIEKARWPTKGLVSWPARFVRVVANGFGKILRSDNINNVRCQSGHPWPKRASYLRFGGAFGGGGGGDERRVLGAAGMRIS